jgi:uncharacterized membrane protein
MRKWYPALLIVIMAIASVIAYPRLPERVPIHWDLHGQTNRWQSRGHAVLFLPIAAVVLWGVLRALPSIDPRRANYSKFQPTYEFMVGATLTVIALIHLAVLASGIGMPIAIHRVIPIALGIILLAIGNQLPRARSNWWFGIRTPWTLSNDRVWERTHRVGGYLMTVAGVVIALGVFIPGRIEPPLVIACVAASTLGSIIYSYFAWKQETSR